MTSTTLPVTLEETVAWRRAVTYPEAFNTVRDKAPPLDAASRTITVRTSSARDRESHQKPAPSAATPASITITNRPLEPVSVAMGRSMRSSSRALFGEVIVVSPQETRFSGQGQVTGNPYDQCQMTKETRMFKNRAS